MLVAVVVVGGCANVPKEAVELSYQIGSDTEALHQSYRKLVRSHFDVVRQMYEAQWREKVLVPYVRSFVAETRLADIAAGKVVWDPVLEKMVPPTSGREAVQLVDTMQAWSKEFSETSDELRRDFMAPIDKAESELLAAVDDSFAQVARGNAAISAHLASLRRVQESQDSILEKAGMKDLRQKIHDGIAKSSDDVADFKGRIEKATSKIEELRSKLKLKGN